MSEESPSYGTDQDWRQLAHLRMCRLFEEAWSYIQGEVNELCARNGWNDKPLDLGASYINMICELGEAWEGIRTGNPASDKIGDKRFSQEEEELADCVYRIMHYAQRREESGSRCDVAGALLAKHEYNKTRPYRHGNKVY